MHVTRIQLLALTIISVWACGVAVAQPGADTRVTIQTVNTPREFPGPPTRVAWQQQARQIREQILVSCGLWPMPGKAPLNANVFGKVVRDGYTIEKVYFESYPGFLLSGNLYRPFGKGSGPFPGILNPHGHWENGRMADEKEGSIAARCINFAKQGLVAFSYDMVGYNDTFFPDHSLGAGGNGAFYTRHRRFATNEVNLLWNISLMGLQTWNSIRSLDFLESLPDVDKSRLACTGESGGGTQTYILGAIDERLAVQAPVVMVSHTMQGGCSCENVSGLRLDYSNVEIAACAAPRPQIVVGATGDWTKDTVKVEGPRIESVYSLYAMQRNLRYVIFDFRHNYNQTSREAVYDFFGKHLRPSAPASKEIAYEKDADQALRVFPDDKLPGHAVTEAALVRTLIQGTKSRLEAIVPTDKKSLTQFKEKMMPAWHRTLQVEIPKTTLWAKSVYMKSGSGHMSEKFFIGRNAKGDRVPVVFLSPLERGRTVTVVLAHPEGKGAYLNKENEPIGLAKDLLDKKLSVMLVDTFLTGELTNWEISNTRKQVELFFTTYNRTDTQQRVQDLITAATFARQKNRNSKIFLCGEGRAGLWSLLAAPAVDAVFADCDKLDLSSDEKLLEPDLFVPGLRALGGFETVTMLAAPDRIYLHNVGNGLGVARLESLFNNLKVGKHFAADPSKRTVTELAARIAE